MRRIKDISSDANGIKEVDIGDGWTEAVSQDKAADGDLVDIDKKQKGTMQVVDGDLPDLDDMEESKDAKAEELPNIDDFDADEEEPEATDNIFAGGKFVQGDDDDDDNIKKVR